LIVLAVDPGTTESAYVFWDGKRVIEAELADNWKVKSLIRRVSSECSADYFAIEQIRCYGMAVGAETLDTVLWSGRFVEAWRDSDCSDAAILIPRLDVKVHLCKSARANDSNVRQALIDRFGPQGTKKNPGPLFGVTSHKIAALAVAVCAHDRLAAGFISVPHEVHVPAPFALRGEDGI
jgi:hypothetical protein